MKRALAFAVGAAFMVGMTFEARSLSNAEKVLVCHVEGNGSAHVIDISVNAVRAHLAHGDSLEAARGLKHGDDCDVNAGILK